MSTGLTEFSDKENSRTYTVAGHTISKPRLVIQKRKVPAGNQNVSEVSIDVIYGTEDADGNVLPNKYTFGVVSKGPINGTTTDRDAALVIIRDVVASDEFAAAVSGQLYLS
jgi:hypothetical protein